jgi:hypothetical protein
MRRQVNDLYIRRAACRITRGWCGCSGILHNTPYRIMECSVINGLAMGGLSDATPRQLGVMNGLAVGDVLAAKHTPRDFPQQYQWPTRSGSPKSTAPTPHPPPDDPPTYRAI